jgi:hypothetical protein
MILDLDQANIQIQKLTESLVGVTALAAARGRLLAEAEAKEAVAARRLEKALVVIKAMTETLEDITRRVVTHCEDAADAGGTDDIDAPIPYSVNGAPSE